MMQRLATGERLTDLRVEYGVSHKTAHKYKARFESMGIAGLYDQPRIPKMIPHKTPQELVDILVAERKRHPTWGPKKLKEVLEKRLERGFPASSTIGDILEKAGLVERRRSRSRVPPSPTGLCDVTE